MVGRGMGGAEPLLWQEIQAYSQQTGLMLGGWESRLIRKISQAYVSFSSKADDIKCPPPYRTEMTDDDRAQQAKILSDQFKKLKAM